MFFYCSIFIVQFIAILVYIGSNSDTRQSFVTETAKFYWLFLSVENWFILTVGELSKLLQHISCTLVSELKGKFCLCLVWLALFFHLMSFLHGLLLQACSATLNHYTSFCSWWHYPQLISYRPARIVWMYLLPSKGKCVSESQIHGDEMISVVDIYYHLVSSPEKRTKHFDIPYSWVTLSTSRVLEFLVREIIIISVDILFVFLLCRKSNQCARET